MRKTIPVESPADVPELVRTRLVGCQGGSSTYHVAFGFEPGDDPTGASWRPVCQPDAPKGGGWLSTAGTLAQGHRFRLCRACAELLEPEPRTAAGSLD